MPVVDVPFPKSSAPGQKPGEGAGVLVNAYCEEDVAGPLWRPVAGLTLFVSTGAAGTFRGAIDFNGVVYAVYGDTCYTITTGATVTALSGTVAGEGPVTFARNNAASPDLVLTASVGTYSVSSSAVSAFADGDLETPNSVASLSGYLLWTTAGGKVFASGLNAVTVDPLSVVLTQANPDGLLRGTVSGSLFYAWGQTSCEVYQDAGTTPFPLARAHVIPVGLRGPWAIAGFGSGWDKDTYFVASDGSVRRLSGYETAVVSSLDIERDIRAVVDVNSLVASVYVEGGAPMWCLSCPAWTWELNTKTGYWHKRKSFGLVRWKCGQTLYFNNRWYAFDKDNSNIYVIEDPAFTENGSAITVTLESGPTKQFPSRMRGVSLFLDWTTGTGSPSGSDDETSPKVSISWSVDGGASWSTPIDTVSIGSAGQTARQVRVNRFGVCSHHGFRFRLETSSPVHRSFRGGRADVAPLRAA